MTRDEALIRAALEMAANQVTQGNYGPVAGHYRPYDHLAFIEKSIRAIDVDEVLAKVGEVETTPAPDAVARLVEAIAACETVLICAQEMCKAGHPVSAFNVATDALRALKGDE